MGDLLAVVGPFRPPYALGGSMAVMLGAWRSEPPLPETEALAGYRPVRLFGRLLAVVVASDFEQPPPELPIRYREVVAAVLIRRGLRIAALPFDMRLDAPVPVELGHRHYSMPKTLDPHLAVHITPGELRLSGEPGLHGHVYPTWLCLLLAPLSALVGVGVWTFTRLTAVIGAADEPTREAQIAITPGCLGRPYALSLAQVAGLELQPWWCHGYAHCKTRLGAPRTLHPPEAS